MTAEHPVDRTGPMPLRWVLATGTVLPPTSPVTFVTQPLRVGRCGGCEELLRKKLMVFLLHETKGFRGVNWRRKGCKRKKASPQYILTTNSNLIFSVCFCSITVLAGASSTHSFLFCVKESPFNTSQFLYNF